MNIITNISKSRSFLMGIAILAILLFHQEFVHGNCVLEFFNHYGHWCVQVFILVSGFGIWYALDKPGTVRSFYIRRLWRIMPASILGGVLALVLTWETSIAQNLLKISGLSLWYIRTILMLYLISPLLYALFKNSKRALWYLVLMVVAYVMYHAACHTMEYWWMGSWRLRQTVIWTLGQVPFYLSGMYLAAEREKIWKSAILVVIGCCLLPVLFQLSFGNSSIGTEFVHNASVLLICAFGYYPYAVFPKSVNRVIDWCGEHSLELYVCHEAIYAFSYNLDKSVYMLPVALVASFLAAYGISVASRSVVKLCKSSKV